MKYKQYLLASFLITILSCSFFEDEEDINTTYTDIQTPTTYQENTYQENTSSNTQKTDTDKSGLTDGQAAAIGFLGAAAVLYGIWTGFGKLVKKVNENNSSSNGSYGGEASATFGY